MKLDNQQDFKKKREEFAINLRKNNREAILSKRRYSHEPEQPHEHQQIVHDLSVMPKLIILDESLRTYLAQLLQRKYHYNQLAQLIELMASDNIIEKHRAVIGIRKLSDSDRVVDIADTLMAKQVVATLVQWYCQEEYLQIKFEILWAFTNLTSASKQFTATLVKMGIITLVSKDIMHPNDEIKYHAIWVTSNIAADYFKYRDELVGQGAVLKIIKFLQGKRSNSQITTAIWALTNLARGNPPPHYQSVKFAVAPVAQALKSGLIKDQSIISDCLWTLSNLSDGGKIKLHRIAQTNVMGKVVSYVRSPNLTIQIPAIRIVGNMTNGTPQQTNLVLNQNYLDVAYDLLNLEKSLILKEVCWTISNITAGTDQQILRVVSRDDLIKRLVKIYPNQVPEVKAEIIWIFTNLEHSELTEIMWNLFKAVGLLGMIGEQLNQTMERCVLDALTCLYKVLVMGERMAQQKNTQNLMVLEFCQLGYAPTLERLQKSDSDHIYRECSKVMERFFNVTETAMQDF